MMQINNFPSLPDHILVWIFGIIFPFLSGLQSEKLNGSLLLDKHSRKKLYVSNSLMLAITGIVIILNWLFQNRPFNTLGFSNKINVDFTVISLIFIFILGYSIELAVSKLSKKDEDKQWFEAISFLPEEKDELFFYFILCLCAGIFEEIIYRGFMVTYFLPTDQDLTKISIAMIAPSLLFSLAHYYQGWKAVFKIFIFSLLLSAIFFTSKNLIPGMIIHFLVDVVSGLAYMKSFKLKDQ